MTGPDRPPETVEPPAPHGPVEVTTAGAFRLAAQWHYEIHGRRRHYLIEAWLDDACVGRAYGWYENGRQLVLQKIEVDDAVRSRGCGSSIIAKLRTKARRAGCGELLITGVRASNRGAIRLYESLGARRIEAAGPLQTYVLTP